MMPRSPSGLVRAFQLLLTASLCVQQGCALVRPQRSQASPPAKESGPALGKTSAKDSQSSPRKPKLPDLSDAPKEQASSDKSPAPRISVQDSRFLTLEQEPLDAKSLAGRSSLWVFWPGLGQAQLHYLEVRAFRSELNQLLEDNEDLVVLEFHHHHKSAQTAPRRDRARHEHLWDPQAVTAMRLSLKGFPCAVLVSPKLEFEALIPMPSSGLPAFFQAIESEIASETGSEPSQ